MIRFVFLNGKRALDRWNQKELLQTPKNREARNILNICHATHASRVNFCARKRERAGPQPFAATPPQHPAAAAVPCRLLPLPRQASSRGEYVSLTTALLLLASGHSRKASKSRHFELKCCWGEAGYLLSFSSLAFWSFRIMFFDFFPMREG